MRVNFAYLGLVLGVFTAVIFTPAYAEVTSDGTTNTTVNSIGNNFIILNGIEKGNNLFHSFSNFSIPTGGSANFDLTNTLNITTIFSRVTGGNVSNIDGLIQTLNSSNSVSLFLMNPNGIVFGQNAKLDISGSFVATTANSIKFADGVEFSTVNLSEPALLTMSVPVGLQIGRNAGAIQVQGATTNANGLQVKPSQTFALIGSDINLTQANLRASDGHIELWALQNGKIDINNNKWQLASDSKDVTWGNISLQKSSFIDADGVDGGLINIRGRSLTLQDGSNISSTTSAGQGRGITIQTTEFVNLLGVSAPGQLLFSGVNTSVGKQFDFFAPPGPPTTGRAGNITIETERLKLANGAWIKSITSGNNSIAGDINIRATDVTLVAQDTSSALSGFSSIATSIVSGSNNQSGKISIEAQRVSVFDGNRIATSVLQGNGSGGEISIRAKESLEIRGTNFYNGATITSGVLASIEAGATGQGGQISVDTGNLIVADGGTIASGLASANNTFFGALPGARGTAGNIDIRARQIQVSDSLIDGLSGDITGITTSVGNGAIGQGGSINLTADNLRVFNGGQIASSTNGNGAAGNINLQAKNITVEGTSQPLSNGQILSSSITVASTTASDAGSINLVADRLKVIERGEISVSNTGGGNSGNLLVNANQVKLEEGGSLLSEVSAGNRGNINLAADVLLIRNGSKINTNATGMATGGNISINAPIIIGLENSDITANAIEGAGGNIDITTQGLFGLKFRDQLTPESDITASSQFGVNGNVYINNFGVDPNSGLVELPANLTDPSQQIVAGCAGTSGNSFVATGRGGIPQNPSHELRSDRTWSDIRNLSAFQKTQALQTQIPASPEIFVQATSWHRNAQGKIELITNKSPAQVQLALTCAVVPKA
ncbi:unknown protein [Calothrix sp. PCC 7716]|nr:unknown protein [Calothrix sp. PCC 7716]